VRGVRRAALAALAAFQVPLRLAGLVHLKIEMGNQWGKVG
jgi:hypothetical protein